MTNLSSTFADFFGGSDEPECLYCGGTDGKLDVAVRDDVTGDATHWQHAACREAAEKRDAEKQAENDARNHLLNSMD